MPPHTTLFLSKKILDKIGFYDENLKISSDYDFIIRLFKTKKIKIFFLDKFTIRMRIGGASNKNIKNVFIKISEDFSIIKKNKMNIIKAILFKNFSKISQFF